MYNERLREIVKKFNFRFPNAQISKDLDYSKGTLSEILKGKRKATNSFLRKFSNFYNIPYEDLIDITPYSLLKNKSKLSIEDISLIREAILLHENTLLEDPVFKQWLDNKLLEKENKILQEIRDKSNKNKG